MHGSISITPLACTHAGDLGVRSSKSWCGVGVCVADRLWEEWEEGEYDPVT